MTTFVELYTKLSELSESNQKAVLDFIESLPKEPQPKKKRVSGLAKGMFTISKDFNDPMEFR